MTTFPVSSLADAGPGTLRQAILDANASAGPDMIDLTAVVGAIVLSSGELQITEQLSIEGPGPGSLTIDAQQASRIFNATYTTFGAPLSIKGLTLANGKTTTDDQGGAAVRTAAWADLTIVECVLRGNVTEGKRSSGGAVYSTHNVYLVDTTIESNNTQGEDADGGGIYSRLGTATLTRSMVADNHTAGKNSEGGGAFGRFAVAALDSTVRGNRTYGESAEGGGISAPNVTLERSTFHDNGTAGLGASGGGLDATTATITASTIRENFTTGHSATGGGLHATSLTLSDSLVERNWTSAPFAAGGGVHAGSMEATITRSTISGNKTLGDSSGGGGIRFVGTLMMVDSLVTGNSTAGDKSAGGGMRSDNSTTIINSTFRGNSTGGDESHGGGLFATGVLTMTDSTIANNVTNGEHGFGGGLVSTGTVTLDRSTVSGNRTEGFESSGGGIHGTGPLALRNTTVSGNSTHGTNADGGGLVAFAGLSLDQATISGNWTEGSGSSGGGMAAASLAPGASAAVLTRSTVANNRTMHASSPGGGLSTFGRDLRVDGSIVAANSAAASADINAGGVVYADWSLIEQTGLALVGANNVVGVPAGLEPLADNGGAVLTHALSAGSPAIDAGDPGFIPPPEYDARGFAFARVANGRIDMGAFESGAAWADFNDDGGVDGADFLAWQRGLGAAGSHPLGDANVDGAVDGGDLEVWKDQFGSSLEMSQAVTAAGQPRLSAAWVDVAMAMAASEAEEVDVFRSPGGRGSGRPRGWR